MINVMNGEQSCPLCGECYSWARRGVGGAQYMNTVHRTFKTRYTVIILQMRFFFIFGIGLTQFC